MYKNAARYASQPGMTQFPMGQGMMPMGGHNRFGGLFPMTPGTNLMQAGNQRLNNPNAAAKPRAPISTLATPEGIMSAAKQASFRAHANSRHQLWDALKLSLSKQADTQTAGADAPGVQQGTTSSQGNAQAANRPGSGVVGMGTPAGTGNAPGIAAPAGPRPTVGSANPFGNMFNPLVAQARSGWLGLAPGTAAPMKFGHDLTKSALMTPGPGGMTPQPGMTAPGQAGGALPPPPPNGGAPIPGVDPSQQAQALGQNPGQQLPPGQAADPAQQGQPGAMPPQGPTDPMTGQPIMAPMQQPPAPPLPANPRPPQGPQAMGMPMDPHLQQRTGMMQNMLNRKDQTELDPTAVESADDLKSQGMAMKAAALKSTIEKFAIAAPMAQLVHGVEPALARRLPRAIPIHGAPMGQMPTAKAMMGGAPLMGQPNKLRVSMPNPSTAAKQPMPSAFVGNEAASPWFQRGSQLQLPENMSIDRVSRGFMDAMPGTARRPEAIQAARQMAQGIAKQRGAAMPPMGGVMQPRATGLPPGQTPFKLDQYYQMNKPSDQIFRQVRQDLMNRGMDLHTAQRHAGGYMDRIMQNNVRPDNVLRYHAGVAERAGRQLSMDDAHNILAQARARQLSMMGKAGLDWYVKPLWKLAMTQQQSMDEIIDKNKPTKKARGVIGKAADDVLGLDEQPMPGGARRGWQWKAMNQEIADNMGNTMPRVFPSKYTPAAQTLASPTKQGLLTALLGAGLGGYLGHRFGGEVGLEGMQGAGLGAGLGGLAGGVLGYTHRRNKNDAIIDALHNLPPGATVGDMHALREQDEKHGMDKCAGALKQLLGRYLGMAKSDAAFIGKNAPQIAGGALGLGAAGAGIYYGGGALGTALGKAHGNYLLNHARQANNLPALADKEGLDKSAGLPSFANAMKTMGSGMQRGGQIAMNAGKSGFGMAGRALQSNTMRQAVPTLAGASVGALTGSAFDKDFGTGPGTYAGAAMGAAMGNPTLRRGMMRRMGANNYTHMANPAIGAGLGGLGGSLADSMTGNQNGEYARMGVGLGAMGGMGANFMGGRGRRAMNFMNQHPATVGSLAAGGFAAHDLYNKMGTDYCSLCKEPWPCGIKSHEEAVACAEQGKPTGTTALGYGCGDEKRAAQDNSFPQRSATGESKGLSYAHKSDDYAQGQAAWEATSKYFKGGSKIKKEPNPFEGKHRGTEKRGEVHVPVNVTAKSMSGLGSVLTGMPAFRGSAQPMAPMMPGPEIPPHPTPEDSHGSSWLLPAGLGIGSAGIGYLLGRLTGRTHKKKEHKEASYAGMTDFAQGFFRYCDTLDLPIEAVRDAIKRAEDKFGWFATEELRDGLEKRADVLSRLAKFTGPAAHVRPPALHMPNVHLPPAHMPNVPHLAPPGPSMLAGAHPGMPMGPRPSMLSAPGAAGHMAPPPGVHPGMPNGLPGTHLPQAQVPHVPTSGAPGPQNMWQRAQQFGGQHAGAGMNMALGGVGGYFAGDEATEGNPLGRWGGAAAGAAMMSPWMLGKMRKNPGSMWSAGGRSLQGGVMGAGLGQGLDIAAGQMGWASGNEKHQQVMSGLHDQYSQHLQQMGVDPASAEGKQWIEQQMTSPEAQAYVKQNTGGVNRPNFTRMLGLGGLGMGGARGVALRNVAKYGAKNAPISTGLAKFTGNAFNQAQHLESGLGHGLMSPISTPLKMGKNFFWEGKNPFTGLGKDFMPGTRAGRIGLGLGLGAVGATGLAMGSNYLDNRVRSATQSAVDEAMPKVQQQMGEWGHNFMDQHGMLNEEGQFSPLHAAGRDLNNMVNPVFQHLGMDPSRMSGIQKAMALGGAGMMGYGAVSGNPYAMGAGGVGMGAGVLPYFLGGQGPAGGPGPAMGNGGPGQAGGGFMGTGHPAQAFGAPPGTRNELELQQALYQRH